MFKEFTLIYKPQKKRWSLLAETYGAAKILKAVAGTEEVEWSFEFPEANFKGVMDSVERECIRLN